MGPIVSDYAGYRGGSEFSRRSVARFSFPKSTRPGSKSGDSPSQPEPRMEWLMKLSFAVLTCNAAMAIYRSIDDPWSLAFVVVTYFSLLLLFWCLHLFQRAGVDAARRTQLKIAVWSLSTLITVMFAYKVAALMVWPLVVVWIMAATVPVGGFYAFFIYRERD